MLFMRRQRTALCRLIGPDHELRVETLVSQVISERSMAAKDQLGATRGGCLGTERRCYIEMVVRLGQELPRAVCKHIRDYNMRAVFVYHATPMFASLIGKVLGINVAFGHLYIEKCFSINIRKKSFSMNVFTLEKFHTTFWYPSLKF